MTLKEAIDILKNSGVDYPEHDARELFRAFGYTNEPIITLLSSSNSPELSDAVERRAKREPLQYIIGNVGFYREEYTVTPDCLIPRSDTEILVDYAVKHIPAGERFADLCAGSGCIGISTLANTKKTECVSVDISKKALELVNTNARNNGVSDRLDTVCTDLLEEKAELEGDFYAILSNPPYIPENIYRELEQEIFYEPKIAFVAENDGVNFYEKLTPLALRHLKSGGFIAYEIGYDQADKIQSIAKINNCTCEIIKDFSGNDRVAVLRRFD